MNRNEWLTALLTEAADYVEELTENRFDRRPNIQGYSLDSQTARDFGVTIPGAWITDVPSGNIYFPAEFPQQGPLDVIQAIDTYNLALETGQHFFIQKSEARRRVEEEVFDRFLKEMKSRNDDLHKGVIAYYTTPFPVPADYLLQLAIDDWAARGLSEGFGHLTAITFAKQKIPHSPVMHLLEDAFPIKKDLVDATPPPDRYGFMQERLGTLYVTHMGTACAGRGLEPKDLLRHMIRIKREDLSKVGQLMKQLYTTSP